MARNNNEIEIRKSTVKELLFVGFIVLVLFFVLNHLDDDAVIDNSYQPSYQKECPSGYELCKDECRSCYEGYYLGSDCECHATEETKQKILYEKVGDRWSQYRDVLSNDESKIVSISNNKCNNLQTYQGISDCIGAFAPRLEAYKVHLQEARSFLLANGDVFSNQLELQENIDDKLVWVGGTQIKLDSAINEYNANVLTQQYKQEALLELLRILALGI